MRSWRRCGTLRAGLFPLSLPVNAGRASTRFSISCATRWTRTTSRTVTAIPRGTAEGREGEDHPPAHRIDRHIAESDDTFSPSSREGGCRRTNFAPAYMTGAETAFHSIILHGCGTASASRAHGYHRQYGPTPLDSDRQPAIDANDAPVESGWPMTRRSSKYSRRWRRSILGSCHSSAFIPDRPFGMELFNANHSKPSGLGRSTY